MPSLPTPGDLHVNRPLTNIAIAYMQQEQNFVAGKVFPSVPVPKQSDLYFVWDRADFHRDEAAEVGPGGEAPIGALRLSTQAYACKVYKYAKLISDQERANQDQPLNLDATAAEVCAQKLLIRRDKEFADKYFATGVWTGSTTGTEITPTNKWDNYTSGDPVADIREQIFQLSKLGVAMSGMTLTLSADVYKALLDSPKFLERYEQTQAAILNEQLMAAVLGIGKVVVPMSVINTAKEGAAATNDFIHSGKALLTYAPASPGLNVPSAGYTFTWTGLLGAGGNGMRMKRYRREVRSADQIEGESAFDCRVVAPDLGVLFTGVLT